MNNEFITITTSEYAELVRSKAYLELILGAYEENRSWRVEDVVKPIKAQLRKEEQDA